METQRSAVGDRRLRVAAADSWDTPCHAMLSAAFNEFLADSAAGSTIMGAINSGGGHAQHDAGLSVDRDGHSAARHGVEFESKGHDRDSRRVPRHQLRRAGDAGGAARSWPAPTGCLGRGSRRDVHVEQPGAPRGLLRRTVHGGGAAHAEHPAGRRADRVHRQPGRGSRCAGGHVAGATAGRDAAGDDVGADGGGRRRGRRGATGRLGQDRDPLRRSARRPADRVRLAGSGRKKRRRNVLHQRHDRQPEGCGVQPPLELPAFDVDMRGQCIGFGRRRPRVADRADVPRERVGNAVRGR